MEIIKEIAFDDRYVCAVQLENGVTVYARNDGIGIGTDGRRYVRVSENADTVSMPPDSIFFDDPNPVPIHEIAPVDVGWTPDSEVPVIL